ncbi:MAG: DUF305 domain-containing protein [Pseudomonadota bacterium]
MRKAVFTISALALLSALSGCGREQQSANDASPDNEMNTIMAATSPFGDAEIRMNDAMMKVVGVNAGDSWVRKMIEHHKGAVEISRQVLTMNPEARVAQMAQQTIDKQTKAITVLERLVAQGNPDPASAELYGPTMDKMHQAMMTATGKTLSETFFRKMLEHHKGAVAMSDIALANGVTGAVHTQVEKTKADQQKEVDNVEAMLSSQPMTATQTSPPS